MWLSFLIWLQQLPLVASNLGSGEKNSKFYTKYGETQPAGHRPLPLGLFYYPHSTQGICIKLACFHHSL